MNLFSLFISLIDFVKCCYQCSHVSPSLSQEIIKKTRNVLESYKPLSTCCNIERGPESSDLPWLTYVILRGHWPCVCILVPTNHPLCPGISSILLICKSKAWLELIWYAVKNLISFRGSSAENIKSIDQCKKQILHDKKFSSCQTDEYNQLQYMCKIWSTTQIHFEHITHNGLHKDKTVISISFSLKNINQSISIKINQSWQSNYQLVMLNNKHQVNSTYKSKTQSH